VKGSQIVLIPSLLDSRMRDAEQHKD